MSGTCLFIVAEDNKSTSRRGTGEITTPPPPRSREKICPLHGPPPTAFGRGGFINIYLFPSIPKALTLSHKLGYPGHNPFPRCSPRSPLSPTGHAGAHVVTSLRRVNPFVGPAAVTSRVMISCSENAKQWLFITRSTPKRWASGRAVATSATNTRILTRHYYTYIFERNAQLGSHGRAPIPDTWACILNRSLFYRLR